MQTFWKEYTEWKSGLTYANLGFGLFAATAAQRSIPTVHRREPIMFYIIQEQHLNPVGHRREPKMFYIIQAASVT